MLQLELSWHGRSVDHVLTYFGRQIAVGSQKPSRIMRQKTCCASDSNTSVRVTRSVNHVLTYSGRQIAVGSQKPSRITRQKTCCASESNTSVRIVFANRSVFDAPIGFVLAWEERGSCLNIFWTTNRGRISETFTNYEEKDLLHNLTKFFFTITLPGQKQPKRAETQNAPKKAHGPWQQRRTAAAVKEDDAGADPPKKTHGPEKLQHGGHGTSSKPAADLLRSQDRKRSGAMKTHGSCPRAARNKGRTTAQKGARARHKRRAAPARDGRSERRDRKRKLENKDRATGSGKERRKRKQRRLDKGEKKK
ncbi:uncharacterized protein G2W53_028782 [Senna tora]|uniref:Uncharacterized protein n=1 Tax=Senna tora TaxID=362788 RepID=A0A834T3Z8_9FABA|nr:uncharacterized protein G2W53_028782 [Senna tora]